jgi:endonuclease/exonuclease/phosphatase (EEP) superfamily protein YafD
MKVITFNILSNQYIYEADCVKEYKGIPKKYMDRDYRFIQTLKFLKKSKADIMLLQEVDDDIAKKLEEKLPLYKVMPLVLYCPTENMIAGEVILIKTGNFKSIIHNPKLFKSSKVGYSTIECIYKKEPLLIINIHLNCNKYDAIRLKETKELVKFIKTRKENIILGGDFNTDSEKVHKMYLDLGFESVIKNNVVEKGTYLCEKPMIDYIYVKGFKVKSSKINNSVVKKKNCLTNTLKTYGSDHYPIAVVIKKNQNLIHHIM